MQKLLILILVLIPFSIHAAEFVVNGVVSISTKLLDTPNNTGKVIENLAANSQITIKQRQNSWTEVTSSENTGWVPTLTIRMVSITRPDNIDGATDVVTERLRGTNKKTVVATLGIRGIDEESLKDAELSEEQLTLLESYQVTKREASQFSRAAGLKSKKVEYFDVTVEVEK